MPFSEEYACRLSIAAIRHEGIMFNIGIVHHSTVQHCRRRFSVVICTSLSVAFPGMAWALWHLYTVLVHGQRVPPLWNKRAVLFCLYIYLFVWRTQRGFAPSEKWNRKQNAVARPIFTVPYSTYTHTLYSVYNTQWCILLYCTTTWVFSSVVVRRHQWSTFIINPP